LGGCLGRPRRTGGGRAALAPGGARGRAALATGRTRDHETIGGAVTRPDGESVRGPMGRRGWGGAALRSRSLSGRSGSMVLGCRVGRDPSVTGVTRRGDGLTDAP